MSEWFMGASTALTAGSGVSIVMVTHNSSSAVLRSLPSIERATRRPTQIIVVDSGSEDDSLEEVSRVCADAVTIDAGSNVGFARGCNIGAERAVHPLLLFLNPDTELDSGSIDAALDLLIEDPRIGAVGGNSRYADGTANPTCCFGEPTLWSTLGLAIGLSAVGPQSSWLNPEAMGGWDRSDTRDVDVVTGCFLGMRTGLFRFLEGFDERFFLYSEDTDLSRRIRGLGLRCVHVATATFVHDGGGSDVDRSAKLAKVLRARLQYFDKHWSGPSVRLARSLTDLTVRLRVAATFAGPPTLKRRWRGVWALRSVWQDLGVEPSGPLNESRSAARQQGDRDDVTPPVRSTPHPVGTRARIAYRLVRHVYRSARSGDRDFVRQGMSSLARIPGLTLMDLLDDDRRECNVCGWTGHGFYPNTGPGYHTLGITCPGCSSLDRHRSLLALLLRCTETFTPGTVTVEVAPMRGFEALLRLQPGIEYTSFDLERHAMERGDITAMRWLDSSVDVFLCFHVLEHIPDDEAALREIFRILRPGGVAVIQVPVDWGSVATVEYDAPDPRDVGHVRRYGTDFAGRLQSAGFDVKEVSVLDQVAPEVVALFGMSPEPIVFACKPSDA